jgi:hypothetical protein
MYNRCLLGIRQETVLLLSTKTTTISRIQQDSEQDNTRFIVKKKIEHKTGRKLS